MFLPAVPAGLLATAQAGSNNLGWSCLELPLGLEWHGLLKGFLPWSPPGAPPSHLAEMCPLPLIGLFLGQQPPAVLEVRFVLP